MDRFLVSRQVHYRFISGRISVSIFPETLTGLSILFHDCFL